MIRLLLAAAFLGLACRSEGEIGLLWLVIAIGLCLDLALNPRRA